MNQMYPAKIESGRYSLQSRLFGHRMKPNQTKYEYLIEFLQVLVAKKEIKNTKELRDEYFPISEDIGSYGLKYMPKTRIGLKRFVYFPNSKIEGKAKVDREAYDACITMLIEHIDSSSISQKEITITVLQNLLYGFNAVSQNRSWFDHNILPVCEEVILPEGMGVKKVRQNIIFEQGKAAVDSKFDYNRYTYMRRGGEIYYLHLLNALNEDQQYKNNIEKRLNRLIHSFPQFSILCNFIQTSWDEYMLVTESEKIQVEKELGAIPEVFSLRNKYTLSELNNFLNSNVHPFEKIEMLSNGILIQMLRMMYIASSTEHQNNCWVMDINYKGIENSEIKKLAISCFKVNEDIFNNYLYEGLEAFRIELGQINEEKAIKDAAEDSYKLFRKLGKLVGLIIPNKGSGMRFSLSEVTIKFLVLSIIPPRMKITLDHFITLLYQHYGIIIGQEEYCIEAKKGSVPDVGDVSYMDGNKRAFAQKLKDCGFLRDLSDATSIVENPYESEDDQ